MNTYETNWTKEEFLTYLFIFCSEADFNEDVEEISIINSKCSEETFKKIHNEFDNDSDYESIGKITNTYNRLGCTTEKEELFSSVKNLFFSDGKFDILERNMLMNLKRILK